MDNELLSRLAPTDLERLRSHLTPVTLTPQQVLQEAGEPFRAALFPHSGLISIRASCGGRSMEASLVGRDGLVGAGILLGQDVSAHGAVVILPGEALSIPVHSLRNALRVSSDLHTSLLSHVQTIVRDVGHTVLATGKCTVEQRVARLLCMAQDKVSGDEFALTHDCVAATLGVRRPGVTVALHVLEGEHAIRSARGRIVIRDRARLEALAGAVYQAPLRIDRTGSAEFLSAA